MIVCIWINFTMDTLVSTIKLFARFNISYCCCKL